MRRGSFDACQTVEEMSEVKHEYYNGEIFAIAGASLRHNEIAANVLAELRTRLRETDGGVYGDLRVQTPSEFYTYPDISVICGKVQLVPGRSDTATNPIVIVEVLSEATEEYDRGDKFELYKSIFSLRHYFVVSQTEILVDHFRRIDSGQWSCRPMADRKDTIAVSEPQVSFSLDDIYRRVF